MNPKLRASIAARYLTSKKSHSAVGAISMVSIAAMSVATAAIICVLSVFNGFHQIITSRLDTMTPDLLVEPRHGKVIPDGDSLAEAIREIEWVEAAVPTLTENALAVYDSREMPVTLKGADIGMLRKINSLDSLFIFSNPIVDGREQALLSIGVFSKLGLLTSDSKLLLFAPKRMGRINTANPASSFITDSVNVSNVFSAQQQQFDENLVIADINLVRELLMYDSEASAIEIRISPKGNADEISNHIAHAIGGSYKLSNRLQQQQMNFHMLSIEKWITFLLLFFILLIASFNIISSLSMLVLEKRESVSTLRALGCSGSDIGGIFFWESIYVAAAGGLSGILLGVALVSLQEHFGLIRLSGDPSMLTMEAYPVALQPADIAITLIPVALIGLLCAFVTSSFARRLR